MRLAGATAAVVAFVVLVPRTDLVARAAVFVAIAAVWPESDAAFARVRRVVAATVFSSPFSFVVARVVRTARR